MVSSDELILVLEVLKLIHYVQKKVFSNDDLKYVKLKFKGEHLISDSRSRSDLKFFLYILVRKFKKWSSLQITGFIISI